MVNLLKDVAVNEPLNADRDSRNIQNEASNANSIAGCKSTNPLDEIWGLIIPGDLYKI
jgi:hypothetical protein